MNVSCSTIYQPAVVNILVTQSRNTNGTRCQHLPFQRESCTTACSGATIHYTAVYCCVLYLNAIFLTSLSWRRCAVRMCWLIFYCFFILFPTSPQVFFPLWILFLHNSSPRGLLVSPEAGLSYTTSCSTATQQLQSTHQQPSIAREPMFATGNIATQKLLMGGARL